MPAEKIPKRRWRAAAFLMLLFAAFVYLNNTGLLAPAPSGKLTCSRTAASPSVSTRRTSGTTPAPPLGPYRGGEFSTGIDTPDDLARLPAGYAGGVWTNEVEMVAHALKRRRSGGGDLPPIGSVRLERGHMVAERALKRGTSLAARLVGLQGRLVLHQLRVSQVLQHRRHHEIAGGEAVVEIFTIA
jgi:hypothetical protein